MGMSLLRSRNRGDRTADRRRRAGGPALQGVESSDRADPRADVQDRFRSEAVCLLSTNPYRLLSHAVSMRFDFRLWGYVSSPPFVRDELAPVTAVVEATGSEPLNAVYARAAEALGI